MKSFWKLGVDVGGTFTDAVLFNPESGQVIRTKVPSTPHDQSEGVLKAVTDLREELHRREGDNAQIMSINHGTTVATNAILEGKGARVLLFVTEGYKDILQVRRSAVPGGLGGWIVWPKPEPLAALDMTIEVPGRISTSGDIIRPIDEHLLRSRISLMKQLWTLPPESITISLINSFTNSHHEREVARIAQDELPGIPLSLSVDVLPELMEYERTVTTVANAYVKPVVFKYLSCLAGKLDDIQIRVLRSDGGLASMHVAQEHCASLLYSGPAGGVAGVISQVAKRTHFKNLLTFDMGGTSTDVCLVENGQPVVRRDSVIGDLTIRAPSLDIRTVGAGGGSVATIAEFTGALRVGPESAGATPGPACYSKGGIHPTVTDAFAVLGWLPTTLLGGSFLLDRDAAIEAVNIHVAKPMNISLFEAAEGIIRIAVEKMHGSLRSVSVEKGKDPRQFHLVSFGGAGGLVACQLSKLCGTAYPTIVPQSPGVLCAYGDACTNIRHEVSCTIIRKLVRSSVEEIVIMFSNLQRKVTGIMVDQGVSVPFQDISHLVDLRYQGQATSLPISFALDELSLLSISLIKQRFEISHKNLFSFSLDVEVEITGLRVVAQERLSDPLTAPSFPGNITQNLTTSSLTKLYYGSREYNDVPIYERGLLRSGHVLKGPCVITELDSNTLVIPEFRAEIDDTGNILLWPDESYGNAGVQNDVLASEEILTDATDPIVVQLIEAGLQNARVEMDTLIQRVAMSPAMREQLDYFPMFAVGEGPNVGRMVCGQFGSFIPGFLESWSETIEEGDIFITNDPYSVNSAISHLNDMLVVTPVFHETRIVAWIANLGHFTDIGSIVPGSMPNCATSIFEDGIQIPLCKLYSRGIPNLAVFKIIERNSRKPEFARSDLQALVAATKIGARRVIEMCRRFGTNIYEKSLDALLERNKLAIGKLIKLTVPIQPVHFEDYIDDDGFGYGPWKIACTMSKEIYEETEVVVFDFEGTDPQSDRSINLALSHEMLKMFIAIYLLTVFDPATIVNDGSFDLIKIRIPEGTILNPIRPAALSCRTHLLGRLFDVIGALFGQNQPEFLMAAGYSDSPHFFFSGWDRKGQWFQLYQIGFGGIPARPHGDGPDGHSLWPSMRAVPNEFLESTLPLRVDRYETVPDSGGEGLYRGGNAIRIDYTFLECGNISIHDDRWYTKPWGVHGGGVGARSRKTLIRHSVDSANPLRITLGSKVDFIEVAEGDTLEWVTWGGGGWGNPLERSPNLVAKEVRRGLVSNPARYGVVLDARKQVDVPSTEALRARMRPTQEILSKSLFNYGGRLKDIYMNCLEETGLHPPKLPSSRVLRGPITQSEYIRGLQERRAKEDEALYG